MRKKDFTYKINRAKSFKIHKTDYQYVFSRFHEKKDLNVDILVLKRVKKIAHFCHRHNLTARSAKFFDWRTR